MPCVRRRMCYGRALRRDDAKKNSLTVQYPINFSKMPDKAYKVPDSEITDGVKRVLIDLEDNGTPGSYSIWGTGNVVMFGAMTKDDIIVYVCKDYDELWIPLKEED